MLALALLSMIVAVAILAGAVDAAMSDYDEPAAGRPGQTPPRRRARPDRASAAPRPHNPRGRRGPEGGLEEIDNQTDRGPVIVGVDGSERSVEALVLADLLGPALGRRVVIAHVHPFRQLSSLFAEGEYERLMREVAESTFEQIREHLPSVPERRMQLVSASSPAAGLHSLAEREGAALIVVGSSHRSRIGRIVVGGTGESLLSEASAPVAVAPAGYAAAAPGSG